MRIAFDIDETLIPYGNEFPVEPPVRLLRWFYRESLRERSIHLLRTLSRQGFDLWIYTTSGRSPTYLMIWFRLMGIRIGGVVNCHEHEKMARARGAGFPRCSKYPPAFGIDLLIDNSEGVGLEGEQHGFQVLVIDTGDRDWDETILRHLEQRTGRSLCANYDSDNSSRRGMEG